MIDVDPVLLMQTAPQEDMYRGRQEAENIWVQDAHEDQENRGEKTPVVDALW